MNELVYSELDSKRFGLVIYRAIMSEIDAQAILKQIIDHNVDTAIIRIPTEQLLQMHKLDRTAMPMIITDTLAYYEIDLSKYQKQSPINSDLDFVVAGFDHHDQVNSIVRETFSNYTNHYRMNPFFDNEAVTEGYQDWMRWYSEGNPDKICWLIKRGDDVVGFAAFNFETDTKAKSDLKAKGILYGVKQSERKNGIFQDLMIYAMNYAKDRGKITLECATQIENLAVQRSWSKLGFALKRTENTIHINSLLSKSVFVNFTVPFMITGEDFNPNKISNRHILKQLNWHFDFKQNIVTQNHRFVNILKMEREVEYFLNFSFPTATKGLLRVTDKEDRTYVLVYFDLKHFVA